MVNTKNFIIVTGILIAGIIAFFIFFQNEEAKIKKQFKSIADKIEKAPVENQIIAAANAKKISEMITNPCRINAPGYSFSRDISPGELSRFVLARRSLYSKLSLKFYDFIIDFPEKNSARVSVTEIIKGTLKTGELVEDLHELECTLIKIEDNWRLTEITVVEVLRK